MTVRYLVVQEQGSMNLLSELGLSGMGKTTMCDTRDVREAQAAQCFVLDHVLDRTSDVRVFQDYVWGEGGVGGLILNFEYELMG